MTLGGQTASGKALEPRESDFENTKWLFKGVPCGSCFLFKIFYVFSSNVGMTFILAGYLNHAG